MYARIRRAIRYRLARHLARAPYPVALSRPIVSVSFDDFPKSAAEAGRAVLDDHGVQGSYYFCADFAGRVVNGIRQYDIDDLAALSADGHEIGCHTASHRALGRTPPREMDREIARNAAFLRSAGVAAPLRTFAYPFGDVSVATKRHAATRFEACRGAWAGVNAGTADRSLLHCVCLEPHILAQKPVGAWLDEAAARNGWVIFLTHDVARHPSDFGVTPGHLAAVLRETAAAGIDIMPAAAALDRIRAGAASRASAAGEGHAAPDAAPATDARR